MNDTQSNLVRHLELSAEWRARKAEQLPDDGRHARSAEALARAAKDVAALSDADSHLSRIDRLFFSGDEEAIATYDGESALIVAQYGFDNADATTDELLDTLAAVADKASVGSSGIGFLPPQRLR